MWSTVVMFILTFAILGLLLGFAEIYNPTESDKLNGSPGEIVISDGNATSVVGSENSATPTDD